MAHPYAIEEVAGASSHTCAVVDTGAVVCFGSNSLGTLGLGNATPLGDQSDDLILPPTVDLGTGRHATSIATGGGHSCAVLDDGSLKCWGFGGNGRTGYGNEDTIGDGAGEMGDALPAVDLGIGRTATIVDAGSASAHTCALLDDGGVKCWGLGGARLGQGNTQDIGNASGEMGDALPEIDLGTGRTATTLDVGSGHACSILDDGALKCWGESYSGQLGLGTNAARGDQPAEMGDALAAVDLGTGRTAVAVATGGAHTCAILDNADLKCWGENYQGQLGLGDTDHRGDNAGEMGDNLPAVPLGTGRTAVAVSAGQSHTCAVLDDGSVKCWGLGYQGQLGHGATTTLGDQGHEIGNALPTVNLGAGRTAIAVATGQSYTCAVLDNGRLKCWGEGGAKLGQGSVTSIGDAPGEMAALEPIELIGSPGPPVLSVEVTASPTTVVAGQAFDVDVTITNSGLATATDLTVEVPNAPACDDTITTLGPGAEATIECSHTTTSDDVGTYPNAATVDAAQTAPVASNTANVTVVLGEVSGTVDRTGSGDPVEGAWVVAVTTGGVFTKAAVTDNAGHYTLDLAAGSYKIELVDPLGLHHGEWHDDAPIGDFGAGTPVTVNSPTPLDVDATLDPAGASGTIAGTVTETGTGTPVAGAWTVAVRVSNGAIVAGARTEPDGTYTIGGLTGGAYRLAVIDPSMAHAYDLFYDDRADFSTGDNITVTPGTTTTVNPDLDPATPPTPNATIEGTVTGTVGAQPVPGAWVIAVNANTGVFTAATEADVNGHYTLDVPAGSYKVEFLAPEGDHQGEWFGDASLGDYANATPVTVAPASTQTADEDLVPLTGTIAGTITRTGSATPIAGAWAVAVRVTDGAMVGWDTADAGGQYTIAGLDVGTYHLAVLDPSGDHAIELFYEDRADFGSADDILVTAGGITTIEPDLAPL